MFYTQVFYSGWQHCVLNKESFTPLQIVSDIRSPQQGGRVLLFPVKANEPYWNHPVTFVKTVIPSVRAAVHIAADCVGDSSPAPTPAAQKTPRHGQTAARVSAEGRQTTQRLSCGGTRDAPRAGSPCTAQ